jgi:hypothetical protein
MFDSLKAFFAAALLTLIPQRLYAIEGDYTGDGKSDLTVVNVDTTLGTTTWSIRSLTEETVQTVSFSVPVSALVPGDYNGDGITEPALVYVLPTSSLEWHIWQDAADNVTEFGINGDRPIVGDFDCDGKADKAVVRTTSGLYYWYFELSSDAVVDPIQFGRKNDKVFASRINSSSCDDLVVARPSSTSLTWYYRPLAGEVGHVTFGSAYDTPYAPADVNGDGNDEFIVIRVVGSLKKVIIRNPDATITRVDIGPATNSTPLSGNFVGDATLQLGRYVRANASSFIISFADGQTQTIALGDKRSILVRPDGTVVQPSEMNAINCGNPIVSIDSLRYVLYKSENIHGGRGPTFLVQNPSERTGKRSILIKDMQCRTISSFGLWAVDWPYGARYYEGVAGGSRHSATALYNLARRAGSSAILVEGRNKWIKVNDPRMRQGNVHN